MAFELCIFVPDLADRQPLRPDWVKDLGKAINPGPSPMDGAFLHIPIQYRNDNAGIRNEDFTELVGSWATFYNYPLETTCYQALQSRSLPGGFERYVHAIHIHRRDDEYGALSHGFTFRVLAGERILVTEIAQWICRQDDALPFKQGDDDDSFYRASEKALQNNLGPGKTVVQTIIYATSSGQGQTEYCVYPHNSWITPSLDADIAPSRVIADPVKYLQEISEKGLYLSSFRLVGSEGRGYNAFGFSDEVPNPPSSV